MIELGALLGAMIITLALLLERMGPETSERTWLRSLKSGIGFLVALALGPVVGAIWGSIVASAIHYAATLGR
jgi:hypothetical protein